MSPFRFARLVRRGPLLLGAVLLSACSKQAEVQPPAPPAPAQPEPQPPKPPKAGKGGASLDPLGGLLGGSAPTGDAALALMQKYQAQLVGAWRADLGDGYTEERTYNADGTYSAKLAGPVPAAASGKYAVVQAVGTKALKLRLGDDPGARTITVGFDGDELEHPSLRPGVTGTFRKK
ncbi:MAG: hypothetical protein J0I06_19485 [Planctomycetes bacterium]|nr:hypothetical protein [Planctomycetota bacterium]